MSEEILEKNEENEKPIMDKLHDYFKNLELLFNAQLNGKEIVDFVESNCPDKDPFILALHIIYLVNQSLLKRASTPPPIEAESIEESLVKAANETRTVPSIKIGNIEELIISVPSEYWELDTTDPEYSKIARQFFEQIK